MRREAARRAERGLPPRVPMNRRKGWRARIGWFLRCTADRLDYDGALRAFAGSPGWSFTYEKCPHHGVQVVFREDGLGCKLWYAGMAEYDRAWEDADYAKWGERL